MANFDIAPPEETAASPEKRSLNEENEEEEGEEEDLVTPPAPKRRRKTAPRRRHRGVQDEDTTLPFDQLLLNYGATEDVQDPFYQRERRRQAQEKQKEGPFLAQVLQQHDRLFENAHPALQAAYLAVGNAAWPQRQEQTEVEEAPLHFEYEDPIFQDHMAEDEPMGRAGSQTPSLGPIQPGSREVSVEQFRRDGTTWRAITTPQMTPVRMPWKAPSSASTHSRCNSFAFLSLDPW